jgi:hypothetical protein
MFARKKVTLLKWYRHRTKQRGHGLSCGGLGFACHMSPSYGVLLATLLLEPFPSPRGNSLFSFYYAK